MSPEPMTFTEYQATFAARIRMPKLAPRPPGATVKRMRVYEELLFNNLEGFLLACFPITREILGKRAWQKALRRFFSEHRCHSPLFRDIPKSFLDWMQAGGATQFEKLPFLAEFMHYEWLELHVSISTDEPNPVAFDQAGDLLQGRPALHPTARVACYHYQVHRIGPHFKPTTPDTEAHCYLLFRDDTDDVRFILLNPLSARLLSLLVKHQPSGREALAHLAGQISPAQYERFVHAGGDLLRDLHAQGALLGTWRES